MVRTSATIGPVPAVATHGVQPVCGKSASMAGHVKLLYSYDHLFTSRVTCSYIEQIFGHVTESRRTSARVMCHKKLQIWTYKRPWYIPLVPTPPTLPQPFDSQTKAVL